MELSAAIAFNKPAFVGNEFRYIFQALENGHASGDGAFTKKCHAYFEQTLGVKKALLTTSCTDALEMSALLLNLRAGDEVIVPSFTFVSTVNAFVLRGCTPIFCDVRRDTLNMDETQLESLITPRTKAIVPVHYAGVGCDMNRICDIAAAHGIAIVEDNAHGLFGTFDDRPLGTFGQLATQSFHETKNFTCGEGGALLINDPNLIERAEILREKGTNRSRFFRGQVDKYTWVDIGSSFLPSDLLAAYLYAQLEKHQVIQAKRRKIWENYYTGLQDWADHQGVHLPHIPPNCGQAYHMFYLILPSLGDRQTLIEHMKKQRINSVFHYLPLHLSDMGRQFNGRDGDCPVTEWVSDRLLRLPFFFDLSEGDQYRVIETVKAFKVSDIARQNRQAAA